ncbi:MAG TPA: hypothetical protein VFI91_09620 [Longimicrobiaceae bacterium]|nr:hypothetical protein [Longimicrobiaceae bacterium]
MTALQTLSATIVTLASTTACGAWAASETGPDPYMAEMTVQVSNHNWSDMVVYGVSGGFRQRLGTVTSMSTRRFQLPRAAALSLGGVHLIADPIGSDRSYSTGMIQVSPGQTIEFNIENNLAISNYSVWGR